MNQKLTEQHQGIMQSIFGHDAAKWIERVEGERLTFPQIEYVCSKLLADFHMNGIDANFEANSYGKTIEDLIDIVNRPRLHHTPLESS